MSDPPSTLRRALSDRLPIVTYANAFAPAVETVWISPQVERLTGYPLEDWVRRPGFFDSVLHPDDRVPVLQEIRASREERRPFSRDYRLVGAGGKVIWVHDESVPIVDEAGEPELIQGYFVDITQRKELERQLLHAQKHEAVGRLASGIAHDFNNFLTAIGGYAALALRAVPERSAVRRHLTELLQTVESATRLTRRLLLFSRGEAPAPCLLDVAAVVEGMRPMLRRVAGDWVRLELDLQPTSQVHADANELEQLVVNLIANARDAHAGAITVSTRTEGSLVILTVVDDGEGMDEDTRARAFEPFFSTKRREEGSGLGLSIVDGIVARAGGTVDVESAPGRGTTIAISLPVPTVG